VSPFGGRSSRLVGLAALLLAIFAGTPAHADARAELDKARASFNARNWNDAEERFRVLLDPKNASGLKERSLISQARMYLGASLFEQGKKDEAKEVFEKLVLDDPTFDPDPLSYPGEAINTFIDVRSSLLEQIRNAQQTAARLAAEKKAREEADREKQRLWLEKVKEQAGEEKITVRHSRVVASLPLGIGQFQNGQPLLGWIFLGAESAALAGTVVTYGMFLYSRDRENDELRRPGGDINQLAPQYHQRAEDIRVVNLGFAGAFLAIAAVGIAQAHVAFVPEAAEKKKRDLPAVGVRPSSRGTAELTGVSGIAPIVTPLSGSDGMPNGLFVGARGFVF
jgi:tetratricopeptide (TPR) repeat protein